MLLLLRGLGLYVAAVLPGCAGRYVGEVPGDVVTGTEPPPGAKLYVVVLPTVVLPTGADVGCGARFS
ncbi:hypothetical protein [Nannocystis pusilla]|uniref:hypothetical protein n=1 Tax=Nannocystis pusilla TaxID=889268 RepID=UPI003B792EE9